MKNIFKAMAAMTVLVAAATTAKAQIQVATNFSKWVEYPLVKKIGVYQTPLTCQKWIERDVPKMAQIEARSLRYEFAWGKDLYGSDAIGGTRTNPTINMSKADFLFDKAREHTQAFVFAHGYMPASLQSGTGGLAWQTPPSDNAGWQKVNKLVANHWRTKGYTNRYVEVWNEPDLPGGFFSGTLDDYLRVYHYAALGAREGDADCKIGGPAIAYMTWWHNTLADYAKANNLPLDFLSGHAYGPDFAWELDAMRGALNSYGNNASEMLLTEYSPYPAAEYAANGPVERAEAAMTFFEAVSKMVEYPDLTYVTWAQYIDPEEGNTEHAFASWDKLGLVDGNEGCRKALFNAFRLYGMMPVNRCQITTGTLKGMSSADEDHVATVLWNTTTSGKRARVRMTHIPFEEGIVETYHIDVTHNSWYENAYDELIPTLVSRETFTDGTYAVTDSVRPQGVYFVRITAADARPSFAANRFAKLVKTHQWFEQRDNSAPYALFDSKTWTAYLSTNTKASGRALVAVTADSVPETFRVRSTDSGNLVGTASNRALCLRVDFETSSGAYTKSVLFHGGIYDANRTLTLPWGTKRKPDAVVKVDDFSNFDVDLRAYAPQGYTGRAIISFDMSNTGAGAKANIQLLPTSGIRLGEVQIDSLADATAVLSFAIDGDIQDVKEVGFRLALDADPLTATTVKVASGEIKGHRVTATVKALTARRNYHVRGYIDGQTTGENVFYTAKRASVTTSTISCNATQLTASLTGNITADNGSKVIDRGFVWCKADDAAEPTMTDNVIHQGKGIGLYKYELQGLSPETDYLVRAYAINRAGIAYGKTKPFSTKLEDAISTPVADVAPADTRLYDIAGRLVQTSTSTPRRGIYIKDGRKVVVR